MYLFSGFGNLTGPIYLYNRDDPYYEFTNFYQAVVNSDGQDWLTTEHYFQAQKFVGTPLVRTIRLMERPRDAFDKSRDPRYSHWRRSDWEEVKENIMFKALQAKFTQHNNLRRMLLGTGDRVVVERSPYDSYWGDSGDGSCKNRLGELLMRLCDDLTPKPAPFHQPKPHSGFISPPETVRSHETTSSPSASQQHSLPKVDRSTKPQQYQSLPRTQINKERKDREAQLQTPSSLQQNSAHYQGYPPPTTTSQQVGGAGLPSNAPVSVAERVMQFGGGYIYPQLPPLSPDSELVVHHSLRNIPQPTANVPAGPNYSPPKQLASFESGNLMGEFTTGSSQQLTRKPIRPH